MAESDPSTALREGTLQVCGQFMYGSNFTFFVDVIHQGRTLKAVYKPRRGEAPLWDFPHQSLAGREVAAYLLSEALGWELVPFTIFRKGKAPLGSGSLQVYIEHDPDYHYFTFSEEDRQKLRPVAVFDLVVNNADRKGGHLLFDAHGHLWAIDHGLCFHEQEKLRTVIWDFAGEAIPQDLLEGLEVVGSNLEQGESLFHELSAFLSGGEPGCLLGRIRKLLEKGVFPKPSDDRRPFPWPPV